MGVLSCNRMCAIGLLGWLVFGADVFSVQARIQRWRDCVRCPSLSRCWSCVRQSRCKVCHSDFLRIRHWRRNGLRSDWCSPCACASRKQAACQRWRNEACGGSAAAVGRTCTTDSATSIARKDVVRRRSLSFVRLVDLVIFIELDGVGLPSHEFCGAINAT